MGRDNVKDFVIQAAAEGYLDDSWTYFIVDNEELNFTTNAQGLESVLENGGVKVLGVVNPRHQSFETLDDALAQAELDFDNMCFTYIESSILEWKEKGL